MAEKKITIELSKGYGQEIDGPASLLRDGGIVIFPTETVYGVAANAANAAALERLRDIKGRDSRQPFTVHLARSTAAADFVPSGTPTARRLSRRLWPGPMTLICDCPRPELAPVARMLSAEAIRSIYHDGTVGLRVPDHSVATELFSRAGVPIVASSANFTGQPPPTQPSEIAAVLFERVDAVIDSGATQYRAPSTIVRVKPEGWSIVRTGVLEERTISRMATGEVMFVCTGNSCRSPIAEYLFRAKLAEKLSLTMERLEANGYVISSTGTMAYGVGAISPGSRDELARRGLDASRHKPQPLTVERIQQAERIFCMSPEHREFVLEMVPAAESRVSLLDPSGPIRDPIGGGPEDYRACAEHIERMVNARVEEFVHEDRHW